MWWIKAGAQSSADLINKETFAKVSLAHVRQIGMWFIGETFARTIDWASGNGLLSFTMLSAEDYTVDPVDARKAVTLQDNLDPFDMYKQNVRPKYIPESTIIIK